MYKFFFKFIKHESQIIKFKITNLGLINVSFFLGTELHGYYFLRENNEKSKENIFLNNISIQPKKNDKYLIIRNKSIQSGFFFIFFKIQDNLKNFKIKNTSHKLLLNLTINKKRVFLITSGRVGTHYLRRHLNESKISFLQNHDFVKKQFSSRNINNEDSDLMYFRFRQAEKYLNLKKSYLIIAGIRNYRSLLISNYTFFEANNNTKIKEGIFLSEKFNQFLKEFSNHTFTWFENFIQYFDLEGLNYKNFDQSRIFKSKKHEVFLYNLNHVDDVLKYLKINKNKNIKFANSSKGPLNDIFYNLLDKNYVFREQIYKSYEKLEKLNIERYFPIDKNWF